MTSGIRSKICVVLLAESDAELRGQRAWALRAAGMIVEEATNAREATLLAHAGRASLMLLDHHLPDGDGWTLARTLKASQEAKDLLIVGLAWHRERADVERALIAGCDAFLEKSCTSDMLVRHARGMLDLPQDEPPLVAAVRR